MMQTEMPSTITAGDTLRFTRSLPDYDPATWTLSYALVNTNGQITFSAIDNGDGTHLIDVQASTTAGWAPGEYDWQAYVSDGTDRLTVEQGRVTILPDFSAQTAGYDGRLFWQKHLDDLKSAYQAFVESGGIRQSYKINDRSMQFKSAEEIIKMISCAQQQLAIEEARAGRRRRRKIMTRF